MARTINTKIIDIEMVRGDTMKFAVEIKNLAGTVNAVSFGCRASATATNYVFQKTLNNGITVGSDGKYTVRVAPEDTATKSAGWYDYDLEFTIGDDVYTPMSGKLHLMQDVTHA